MGFIACSQDISNLGHKIHNFEWSLSQMTLGIYDTEALKQAEENLLEIDNQWCFLERQMELLNRVSDGPIKSILFSQFDSLHTAYDDLKNKLKKSYVYCQNSEKINAVYLQFKKMPDFFDENAELEYLQRLKDKNLKIICKRSLNPEQLLWCLEINRSISKKQKELIGDILSYLKMLIFKALTKESNTFEWIDLIHVHLFQKLPQACGLGKTIQQKIFKCIWMAAGNPEGDDNWGANHALDDLRRLAFVIEQQIKLFGFEILQMENIQYAKKFMLENSFEAIEDSDANTLLEYEMTTKKNYENSNGYSDIPSTQDLKKDSPMGQLDMTRKEQDELALSIETEKQDFDKKKQNQRDTNQPIDVEILVGIIQSSLSLN